MQRGTLAELSGNGGSALPNHRLEARLAYYGFLAIANRFTSTPEIGFSLSNGNREYSLSWRPGLDRTGLNALELLLEGTRHESANDIHPAKHSFGFRPQTRW